MSFYRNVDQRVWGDRKFRSLSTNARLLWFYLLTGPHVGPVPGLACVGRAGLAEALGWDLAAFDACFSEIASKGMAEADWDARVVWLPNAVKHNEPDSENNVSGWQRYLETLPDSDLTERATRTILAQAREMLAKRASERAPGKAAEKSKRSGANPHAGPAEGPRGGPPGGPPPPPPPPPPAPPAEAGEGEGEGKGKQEEGSGEDSPGAAAPAPPVAEVVLSEAVAAARATLQQASGVEYPVASFAKLDRAVRRKQVAQADLALVVHWAAGHEFWRTQPPSVLFRREKFAELLAQARAGPPKRDGPPQPTIRKIKGVAEALAT